MNKYSGPIAWMSRHKVAPNLLMAFLIIGGLMMSLIIRKEFIPSADLDVITVQVVYSGATPTEMEQGVVLPIEHQLSSLNGFSEVKSTARQGSASVVVELENDTDPQQAYQDIQQAVNNITTFPAGIERPVVSLAARDLEVMKLVIYGPISKFELKTLAEQVEEQLLSVPEISKIKLGGTPASEIHIEVEQQALQRYGLTISDVASRISNNAVEQSAGSIKTNSGEILVTLDDRIYWAEEFGRLPIISDANGVQIRLDDIATVTEGFNDSSREVTFNGADSMRYRIYRAENQTPLSVTQAAYKQLELIRATLPDNVQIEVTDDKGQVYQDRVGLLLKNAAIGLVLLLLLLSIFLEYRLAFWVTVGIPTSFLGALLILPLMDVSINMISMFAFIVALGIVVDDAIIAGENIFEHMQQGVPFQEAAIKGAQEVAMPLAFAILTNVAAFLPLLALPGVIGKFFIAIPLVVISCFLISWIEALFIMPTHLANIAKKDELAKKNWLENIQISADKKLQGFIEHYYQPALKFCLNTPAIAFATALFFLSCIMAWAASGRMGFSMFPQLEGDFVVANIELPENAPLSKAREVRDIVQAKLYEAVEPIEASGKQVLISVESDINSTSVEVEGRMVDFDSRPLSTAELVDLWRDQIGDIAGIQSLSFNSERGGGPSGGAALTIELRGSKTEILAQASSDLVARLNEITGINDVVNSFSDGKPQWDIALNDKGRSLGLEANNVAAQVRAALDGSRALRQQRNSSEVTVLVRLPENERSRRSDIEQLLIHTPANGYVPLVEVATLIKAQSPTRIVRRSGRQVITINADIKPRTQIPAVTALLTDEIFPDLQSLYPSIDFNFEGQQARTKESIDSLKLYGTFSLILIYSLLAIPFRSYSQPLLIMAIIPFGAAGAILGHILLGYGLSIMSIMGIVALAGVVVNDSLILIDYANKQRLKLGISAREAIERAGVRRFRPILLTTLTTFGGLAPMVFETSRQAQFITPMAVSLGFGILFTTFVCLLVLPSLYMLLFNAQSGLKEGTLAENKTNA